MPRFVTTGGSVVTVDDEMAKKLPSDYKPEIEQKPTRRAVAKPGDEK